MPTWMLPKPGETFEQWFERMNGARTSTRQSGN